MKHIYTNILTSIFIIFCTFISVSAYTVRNSHPRIYFNDQQLVNMRSTLSKETRGDFASLRAYIDRRIADSSSDSTLVSGQSRILTHSAFVASVMNTASYIEAANHWLQVQASVSAAQGDDKVQRDRLLSLSIGYDWLSSYLSEEEKETVKEAIMDHPANEHRQYIACMYS